MKPLTIAVLLAAGSIRAQTLELNKPVERALSMGEVHTYDLPLAFGRFVRLVVEQQGIDVTARLSGPDGAKLVEVEVPGTDLDQLTLSLNSQANGNYRLEVRPQESNRTPGHYSVNLAELRAAVPEDEKRI